MIRNLLIKLLFTIISLATPEIRKAVCDALEVARAKARETENQFDDLLIDVIQALLACNEK